MNICNPNNIKIINESECLSESVNTINSNFANLSAIACSLKERIDAIRLSRTFFYYGPNSNIVAYNDIDNTIPSDFTITTFVNSPQELDLQSVSRPGDIVYIVHQKTGVTPILNRLPTTYNAMPLLGPAPLLTPTAVGGQFGADFLPGSFFMRYRRSVNVNVSVSSGTRNFFTYKRINSNGTLLSNPSYVPIIIQNQNNVTQTYTVRWSVSNTSTANIPAGDYSFQFGIEPGQSFNFKNRMQEWLLTNLGKHNVNIEGSIEISATTAVTVPPESRFFSRPNRPGASPRRLPPTQLSTTTNLNTQTTDIDIDIAPIFYVWKLTYERRPGRDSNRFMYYINNGWPRIFRAQTSGVDAGNWNQPQTWTTYNSWL